MARHAVIGNHSLTVGLNEHGLVHDFYYPYVGLENLTNARSNPHHVGVWVDGVFSWIHEGSWQRKVELQADSLTTHITLTNTELQLQLQIHDFVDIKQNVFGRKVQATNTADNQRSVRLFFHQAFQISADGRGDTAMYVPEGNYILDYKGKCNVLAYAEVVGESGMDQYTVGNTGIEGKEGTFKDAEDGELSMAAVEHASVDSTLRVSFTLDPSGSKTTHYWLAVGDTQKSAEDIHKTMLGNGFESRFKQTILHWNNWLEKTNSHKTSSLSTEHKTALKKSLLTMAAHIDIHGGIIASCDSSIYNYGRDYYSYVWPRDGAYVVWPLIKLGYTDEPKKFFDFCKSIVHQDGYMLHKYQPDKAIGSTWHPLIHGRSEELAIQEDETAVVVFMLSEYLEYSGDLDYVAGSYDDFIKPAADWMVSFIDEQTGLPHASYDLWEEKFLTNTYTAAVTYKALERSADIAGKLGKRTDQAYWANAAQALRDKSDQFFNHERQLLYKGFLLGEDGTRHTDNVLDVSSLYGAFMFNYCSTEHIQATATAIEEHLLDASPSGGSPRYEDDNYFKSEPAYRGNPWFVTTLWMAQFYARNDQQDKTRQYIDWTLKNALPSGVLSEQISPEDSQVVGVTPLVWSHAELINTLLLLEQQES